MTRRDFLRLAVLAEGGALVLALLLGWLSGINPWAHVAWTVPALVIGLLATGPIFLVYAFARDTRSIAIETIGPALALCRWYDLIALAAFAGIGEELLFRGVLQPWFSGASPWVGFAATNVLFGLVHFVTPTYAVIAGGLGMYLSLIAFQVPGANLLSAVIAHGLYDYVAFLLIIREYRQRHAVAGAPPLTEPVDGPGATDASRVDDSSAADAPREPPIPPGT